MDDGPILIDVGEVARLLSVGQRSLWRWISTGDFPPPDVALGRKFRRWRRETVLRWISDHSAVPATAQGGGHE